MIRSLYDNKGIIGYLGKCMIRWIILVIVFFFSLVLNKFNYYIILFIWKVYDLKFVLN